MPEKNDRKDLTDIKNKTYLLVFLGIRRGEFLDDFLASYNLELGKTKYKGNWTDIEVCEESNNRPARIPKMEALFGNKQDNYCKITFLSAFNRDIKQIYKIFNEAKLVEHDFTKIPCVSYLFCNC